MNIGIVDAIDALLPQTQCTKCGYDGCRPYAEALAAGQADLNQCPPGGADGIRALAKLLGRAEKPLNPANGVEQPRRAALIDEARCIGCMLCIRACPVDAIMGAPKRMHTVLTESCTGCDLCLPPCPVDCIDMVDLESLAETGNRHAALLAARTPADLAVTNRTRYRLRGLRLQREGAEQAARLADKARGKLAELEQQPGDPALERKKAAVRAAIERAQARRAALDRQ